MLTVVDMNLARICVVIVSISSVAIAACASDTSSEDQSADNNNNSNSNNNKNDEEQQLGKKASALNPWAAFNRCYFKCLDAGGTKADCYHQCKNAE